MGRLMTMIPLMAVSTWAAASGIPQEHKDAIREYHTKQIMGSSQDITLLQPDVVLYRKIFERKENVLDQRHLPEVDPIPFAQIFKKSDLTLGQVVKVAAAASGYDAEFHPQVNQDEIVKINSRPNSLTDIAEYLSRVSKAELYVYQESRVLMAMPKQGGL